MKSEDDRVQDATEVPLGSGIYYTGDIYTKPQRGVVEAVDWNRVAVAFNPVAPCCRIVPFIHIGTVYQGRSNPRYVTEQAYRDWQAE